MRTGVLAHGRHLQMPNWEKIMWGEPPGIMGHIPEDALVAIRENAEIMVFGSGASEKDGKKEAQYIRDYLLNRFSELAQFTVFRNIDLIEARERIERIAILDVFSLNTAQEIRFAGKIFEDSGIERAISVTSRTHAPRCLNEALKFYGRPESRISIGNVLVYSSDTGWASNDDVLIFEPPHRPEDLTGAIRQQVAKTLFQPEKLIEVKKTLGL